MKRIAAHVIKTDAGRSVAGEKRDCTVRATSIALGLSYETAHAKLKELGRKDVQGFHFGKHADKLGLEPVYEFSLKRASVVLPQIPAGRWILSVNRHVFAVVDGIVYDKFVPFDRVVQMAYRVPSNFNPNP